MTYVTVFQQVSVYQQFPGQVIVLLETLESSLNMLIGDLGDTAIG